MIRDRSNDARSLDDALRDLKRLSWDQRNASYYLQGRGYTEADVEHAVSDAMGTDMHSWFESHVGGTDDPPFDDLLALVGLRIDRSDKTWQLAEIAGASPRQLAMREHWLTGARRSFWGD